MAPGVIDSRVQGDPLCGDPSLHSAGPPMISNRPQCSGFTLGLVLSPLANLTENWQNKKTEFLPIFANFTKIRAEIGSL